MLLREVEPRRHDDTTENYKVSRRDAKTAEEKHGILELRDILSLEQGLFFSKKLLPLPIFFTTRIFLLCCLCVSA